MDRISDEIKAAQEKANEESLLRGMKELNSDMFLLGICQIDCQVRNLINEIVSSDVLIQAIKDKYQGDEIHMDNLPTDKLGFSPDLSKAISVASMELSYLKDSDKLTNTHVVLGLLQSDKASFAYTLLNKYGITDKVIKDYITGITPIPAATGKSKKKPTLLESFSINLNTLALESKLKPVIGRQVEIIRTLEILGRKEKNNPILVGEPGTGKTSIAEGIALAIVNKQVPVSFYNKIIFNLDINSIVSGTKYRGEFEERMKLILSELKKNPNYIVFIDEFHTAIGAGNGERGLDLANIIKPALARGEFQCIGATTFEEYKQIEKDGAFDRRFQKVTIEEPTVEETIKILTMVKPIYEAYHNLTYSTEAIEECVKLADRYISNRMFPDKAFDLLDESGSKVKLKAIRTPSKKELQLEQLEKDLEVAKGKAEYKKCSELKVKIDKLKPEVADILSKSKLEVTIRDVKDTLSSITGIPLAEINKSEVERLQTLEVSLKSTVIGQDEAIKKIAFRLKRNALNIRDFKKPIGNFMFLGVSGCGKTWLVKQLAKLIYGNEESIVRFDMSEYSERIDVTKLIGAAPGYVGYEQGGQLTEKVRRKPHCILLFDEIEKAHPDIFNLFLQMLDEGVLTDSLGKKTSFKNCIIIFTSNIGSANMLKKHPFGLGAKEPDTKGDIFKSFEGSFRKEFINRLDEVVMFNPLTPDNISNILEMSLKEMETRFSALELKFKITDAIKEYIAKRGYSEKFGVRELNRTLEREIENLVVDAYLENKISKKKVVKIDLIKDVVVIK